MQQSIAKRFTQARRLTVLSAAISVALATSLTAQGAEAWVSTKTKAFNPAAVKATTSGLSAPSASVLANATELSSNEPVEITVGLKLRNEAQLDKQLQFFLSGATRQYLTPAQFTEQYGPTQKQVDTVVKHLTQAGYSNINVAPNRLFITATGTTATAKKAFNTTLKQFQKDGSTVFANTTDAQVPQSLSGIVDTVLGLQTAAVARTYHHEVPLSTGKTASDARTSATPAKVGHNPLDFSRLYGAGTTPTASNTAVGIVTWGSQTLTVKDLNTYTTANNLSPVSTSIINIGSGSHSKSNAEWQLDSQSIVGAAGGAVKQIIFYNAPDRNTNASIVNAFNRAVTDNVVKVINASFGQYEGTDDSIDATNTVFKQAIAQGQTVSVSSGDEGVYEKTGGVPNGANYTVSTPASSPYAIAVGGTGLYTDGTAYSSETVWNEGLSGTRIWATGGGYSTLQAAPTWQTTAITGSTKRALPDIAFDADGNSGAQIYYNGKLVQYGGTSLASPIFVGIWARLQSANNNTLGFPAASIYKYFSTNTDTTLVHDITSGNNGYGSNPGYVAKAGWDASTGFGSFDISKLNAFIKANPDFSK
ncbi:S53 family peptidase [Aquirhabdus parva]|uniref:Peptidase S53 n=1 Tax=Aquirhabdus parva TaxID=2283318 RepID=A0A345P2S0_9GAMM|nr:S53 family peptidase [Aquirhabdus parva]AXI01579.1 peptidase S53 [Aquirhabdus parva]